LKALSYYFSDSADNLFDFVVSYFLPLPLALVKSPQPAAMSKLALNIHIPTNPS